MFMYILNTYSGDATCQEFRVPNGRVEFDRPPVEDGQYPPSTRATVICNEGRIKEDPNGYSVCQTSGQWQYNSRRCSGS